MQVSYGRLQAYAGMGFLAFAMIVMGSPIGNTGTWFGSMVMIGLGLWIELSDTTTKMRTRTTTLSSRISPTMTKADASSAFVVSGCRERG